MRTPRVGIEVDDVVARLVAVRVLSDEARHVEDESRPLGLLRLHEERVELLRESRRAAEHRDESLGVLHHVPRVLPGVAFREVVRRARAVSEARGIERRAPRALRVAPAHEAERLVEHVAPVRRPLAEERRVLLLAELLRHLRGAPVVVRALERARHALALDLVERVVAVLVEQVPALLAAAVVLLAQGVADRLVRLGGVEPAEALQVGVHDRRHRVRADHALVVLAPERPDRQVARRLVVLHHRGDEPRHVLGREERVERMRGAEGVPQRERGVVVAKRGCAHLVVRAAVASVDVRDVVRVDEEVVERGVEVRHLVGVALRPHAAEEVVPLRARLRAHAVEVPAGNLGGKVAARARQIDGGERHLHEQRAARRHVEVEDAPHGLLGGILLRQLGHGRRRLAELHHVGELAVHPQAVAVASRHAHVVLHGGRRLGHVRVQRLRVAHDAPLRVDEHVRARAQEREAVDRRMRRHRHLHLHAVIRERHAVVAGRGRLRRLRERARVRLAVTRAGERHHEDVAEVGTPRAAEVRLREAENVRVGVAVAARVVPAEVAGVGSGLHEAEWVRRGGEAVSVEGAADGRVDMAREVLRRRRKRACERCGQRRSEKVFDVHAASIP